MLRSILVLFVLSLCAGCATISRQSESRELDTTLVAYANALRWGGWEQALAFVAADTRKRHPLTALDMERFKQVRVASYNEQPAVPVGPHEVRQVVQIGLININTQTERTIVDNQLWRYDEKDKHWHLVSGLPDITQR
ncbi:MAG: hypothetical protein WBV39_00580 [Rudaea sp.]